jgi:hypothetical protein
VMATSDGTPVGYRRDGRFPGRRCARPAGLGALRRLDRHPLRDGRGHRQDHHQPSRGAQRLPAADGVRAFEGVHPGPGRPRDRRRHPHRGGAARLLLGRRPEGPGRRRLPRRRRRGPEGDRAAQRPGAPGPDPPLPQARRRHGGRLRHRRRPRPARGVRPHHRRRQRPLRPDRPAGRLVRRRVRRRPAGPGGGPEEGPRDLVPVPPVRRPPGPRDGPGERRRPSRRPRGGDRPVVPRDARPLAAGPAPPQVRPQRGGRRPGRPPAAGRRRHPALLHGRGGPGGARRLRAEAPPRLLEVPAAAASSP